MPILATPSIVTPPAASAWPGLGAMTWTGWDGTVWDLLGEQSSLFLTRDGVRGLAMPRFDRFTNQSPALAGARWRGSRALEREVFWPLFLYGDAGSQAWQTYDRAFWRTMHPDKPGVWSVTDASGLTRQLRCRFTDDGDHSWDADPLQRGWDLYTITLVAEQPFWSGDPITRVFATASSSEFFSDPGDSYAVYISPASTLTTASVDNPGDVDAYPVWTITGPSTSVTVGTAGRATTYASPIADGNTITIDTRPDRLTVVDQSGVDRSTGLSVANFAPISPGNPTDLSLSMVGSGSVRVDFTPQFFRAY